MKFVAENEKYGTIVYEENFWTGKREITIDGKEFKHKIKNVFVNNFEGKETIVKLKGSYFSGVRLMVIDTYVDVVPRTTALEYFLAFFPLFVILVWGNSPYFCSLLPVVGGIIGGAISVFIGMMAIKLMRLVKHLILKILIGIGMFAVTVGICHLVALVILSLAV